MTTTTTKLICILLVLLLATLSGARGQDCCQCSGFLCRRQCGGLPVCGYNNNNPATPNPPPPPAPVVATTTYGGYTLFAFGDSFADNGNTPKVATSDLESELIRSWYIPYGYSFGNDDGSFTSHNQATGRFSNYMVQSDFVAKMLGLDMAPRPHKEQQGHVVDDAGMTFATAGSGVYSVPEGVPTLSQQVDTFQKNIQGNSIPRARLARSVALVAISGNDYDRVGVALPSGFADVSAFTKNVTSAIADAVDRIRALGVPKVLVNNLHPLGSVPAQTRASNHKGCDGAGNTGADTHNKNLAGLMKGKDGVLVVDLHSAFTDQSRSFYNKLTPCCQGIDPKDLCGDTSTDGDLYSLCDNPKEHFYWDEMHPTHNGWAAVMAHVEDSIKQFVGVDQD